MTAVKMSNEIQRIKVFCRLRPQKKEDKLSCCV